MTYDTWHISGLTGDPEGINLSLTRRSRFRDFFFNSWEKIGTASHHYLCCRTAIGYTIFTKTWKWADDKEHVYLKFPISTEQALALLPEGEEPWWLDHNYDDDSEEEPGLANPDIVAAIKRATEHPENAILEEGDDNNG